MLIETGLLVTSRLWVAEPGAGFRAAQAGRTWRRPRGFFVVRVLERDCAWRFLHFVFRWFVSSVCRL